MKKYFYLATALVALASCSSNDFVGDNTAQETNQNNSNAIVFSSGTKGTTRADHTGADAANLLNKNFVVEGVKGDGSTKSVVFDNYNVNWVNNTANTTTSNTANWEYVAQAKNANSNAAAQSIKYWDYATSQYDFIAYSLGTSNTTDLTVSAITTTNMKGNDSDNDGKIDQGAYTIKGSAANLAKAYIADLKTVYRDGAAANDAAGDYNKEVELKFRSLSAKVRVALYETVPGYSVKDVVFYTAVSTKATDGKAHLYTTDSYAFNNAGTYIVYFPTTGSSNKTKTDYNKAHVSFTADATDGTVTVKEFGAMDYTNKGAGREVAEAEGKIYLGRSSNAATYAGASAANYYTVVIPNETGAVLNLKVDYTLVSTDGSAESIKVTGASAQVPAVYASWKSGYAYTYIFKISQNTNGATNPSAGPAGLYPITFDAVVTETEDGIQETITTVATPSITTYSKGVIATANDEYKKDKNIYVVVENGTALTVGTNANLYTVTLEASAAQTINEASVANAIANGTYDSDAKTYTVTDANGKKMVVTTSDLLSNVTEIAAADAPDGNAITVNGAVFKPTAAGTYVFEYINGTDKYYKIIKVVE